MESEQNKMECSLEELLYYMAFAIIFFTKGIGLDEGSLLFRFCLLAGIFLLAIKFFVGKYSIGEIVITGILGIWGVYTFKITGSLGMFIYILLIVGMKHVPVKRVLIVGTAVWSICMFYCVTASVFWGRTGIRLVHEKLGLGPILRESLGYTHPNVLHITYIVLMALVLYLCGSDRKKMIIASVILLLGDVYIFMYSLSLTGLLFSFLLLFFFFWFCGRKELCVAERLLVQVLPILCVVISVVLPLLLEDGILYKIINKILNNRVWAIRTYFEYYDVTLFGGGNEGISFSLDNSYVSALNSYGCIPLVIIIIAYVFLLKDCLNRNRRAELAIICTFLIAGLSEPFMFNASVKNITVIFIGDFLYRKIKEKGYIFPLFSSHNKLFLFSYAYIATVKNNLLKIKWKTICIIAFLFGGLCFICLLPKDCMRVNKVYADEALCDVAGDTLRLQQGSDLSQTLFVEDMSYDTNYYLFTYENSNLIDVMNLRFKVSVSLYVFIAVGLLGSILQLQKQVPHEK